MRLIERVDTVCLKVRDIEKSSRWYQETLGLVEHYKEEHYVILKIGESGVPLTLEKGEPNSGGSSTYPIFFSSSIEKAHQVLSSQGVVVTDIKQDGLNTYFELVDPDGNKSQLCNWK